MYISETKNQAAQSLFAADQCLSAVRQLRFDMKHGKPSKSRKGWANAEKVELLAILIRGARHQQKAADLLQSLTDDLHSEFAGDDDERREHVDPIRDYAQSLRKVHIEDAEDRSPTQLAKWKGFRLYRSFERWRHYRLACA